ncbi:hypothetical protein ACFQMJ_01360 [Cohnella cellulosilytica]|uniref:Glycine zipper 2TM domain-containing protein n=1 Tax=Cohnella cellulosilytica TaxID=986710 RepID=A0ABW2F1U6_9BACL
MGPRAADKPFHRLVNGSIIGVVAGIAASRTVNGPIIGGIAGIAVSRTVNGSIIGVSPE